MSSQKNTVTNGAAPSTHRFGLSTKSSMAMAVIAVALITLPRPGSAQGRGLAAEVERLGASPWIERVVSLSDLGFRTPTVFSGVDARRDFYLPVPPNLAIDSATLQVDAGYTRGDGGKTNLLASLDGHAVTGKAADKDLGDASFKLSVDGARRAAGVVRLGLHWYSVVPVTYCAEPRADANVLRLMPTTRLSYRFDSSLVRDLATAWGALPPNPVLGIAGKTLDQASYHAAVRMGLALESAGKRAGVAAVPSVGDEVDLSGLSVSPLLRSIPAFAAFGGGGRHALKTPSELAAFLLLGGPSAIRLDLLVTDETLVRRLANAFDELATQVGAQSAEAGTAFAALRARDWGVTLLTTPVDFSLRLSTFAGRPVILLTPAAAGKAATLVSQSLQKVLLSREVLITDIAARKTGQWLALQELGGAPGSFDVLARGDWTTSFDIGKVSHGGFLPAELLIDLSSAPSAAGTRPIASVFLNDVLLSAKQLDATGLRERISAKIPRYALAANNVVKVTVQRQPASDQCRETPQAYPVSVHASSHLRLDKAEPSEDFAGMAARFASGSQLLVPAGYLADAIQTLPRVIRLAATVGVSPADSELVPLAPGAAHKPASAFVSVNLEPANLDGGAQSGKARLWLDHPEALKADLNKLDRVGVFELVHANGQAGVSFQLLGAEGAYPLVPFRLSRGDKVVIDADGPLLVLDSRNPAGATPGDEVGKSGLIAWTRWAVIGVFLGVTALVLGAWWVRRRHKVTAA